jgi:hypothetical protein
MNPTGTQSVPQQMESSAAINAAAGGSFHVGVPAATLAATINFKLGGTEAGTAFGMRPPGAVTQDVKWYTGASPGTELTGSEAVTAQQLGPATNTTGISGTEFVISATGAECRECSIENSGGVAVGTGRLKFTGVSLEKPAKCSVPSTITTKGLTFQADWMNNKNEEPNYWKIVPTAGEEAGFFTLEITGSECVFKTTIVVKGSLFFQSVNATGTQEAKQQMNSSGVINMAAGGNFHLGSEPMALAETLNFKMSGAKAGTAFGTH